MCYNRLLLVCLMVLLQLLEARTQNLYDIRFRLSTLDTTMSQACYDLELSNAGSTEWNLANYNIAIFYDAQVACLSSDSLLLDDLIYDPARTDVITSAAGTPLPYEDSLGFIRVSLSANSLGILMDTFGTWAPTIRLCFDLKISDITSPNTCFQLDVNSEALRMVLGVPGNIVQQGDPNSLPQDVLISPNANPSIVPDRRLNSCFTIEEDTDDLCTDGIDNDEDGLVDCMDLDGCSPGSSSEIFFNVEQPTCDDSLGFIRANGASLNSIFSIDDGISFQQDSLIDSLTTGTYNVLIRKMNITVCDFSTPVLLEDPICLESDPISCNDGIDNDGDGLIDCEDTDCFPGLDAVNIDSPNSCPGLDNGRISIETADLNLEYSIDGGMTYQDSSDFSDLSEGVYVVIIRSLETGCTAAYELNPVMITADTICPITEICDDGIDNNFDGLVDCLDAQCANDIICQGGLNDQFYIANSFTPGSITNNRFGVSTASDVSLTIREFQIYDRFGNLVFERKNILSSDPNHQWDGSINNQKASPGVYVYKLRYLLNNVEFTTSSDVTILY